MSEKGAPPEGHDSTLIRYRELVVAGDEAAERLARLAGTICEAPIAFVAEANANRTGFASASGIDLEQAQGYLPLATYLLLHRDVTVVKDVRLCAELQDVLGTADSSVRMLAGRRLADEEGASVGVLCVCDSQPRALPPKVIAALEILAQHLEAHVRDQSRLAWLHARHEEHLVELGMLRALLRGASSLSIIGADPHGTITSFNEGAEKLLGYQTAEVTGWTTLESFHDQEELRERAAQDELASAEGRPIEVLLSPARNGETREAEWTYVRKDGRRVPVSLVVAAMRSEAGKHTGYVAIAKDVTERREVERLKNEFISTVSHELRTPLTAIAGSLGLLAGGVAGELSPRAQELVAIAKANAERQAKIVNDILDLSKIEAGDVDIDLAPQDATTLVRSAVKINEPFAKKYGVELQAPSSSSPVWVKADHDRIAQVLTNLISNAVKFSPAGDTVELQIDRNGDWVRLSVQDHGPGIGEEFRERVFEKFSQEGNDKGGTGLGLSIVRAIVEQHGGSVGFRSEAGEGTTFYFDLPRSEAPLVERDQSPQA